MVRDLPRVRSVTGQRGQAKPSVPRVWCRRLSDLSRNDVLPWTRPAQRSRIHVSVLGYRLRLRVNKNMEFRKLLALRGPNIWASFAVLEAWLDLGALKDLASSEAPGFNERLMNWLPTMIEHRCSVGERGGFFE